MTFKLTYSTMFDPPDDLHVRFEAAVARVEATLGATHALYVAGRDRAADATAPIFNPADRRQRLGEFSAATVKDVNAAMQAAHEAFADWSQAPVASRMGVLRRVGALIEERVFDIGAALTLEVGKNRMEALAEAQETAEFFYQYCEEFERRSGFGRALPNDPIAGCVSRNRSVMKPYGAWVVIAPFNFPLALAGGPTAAALITGNTVVLKGANVTPWAGRMLADCMRDAGVPPGVFNYLGGGSNEVGEALVEHPLTAGVTFTGSQAVGMQIARRLLAERRPRPCIVEMGGKNPCIVTAAADLECAVSGIVRSAFGMCGQKCSALSRLYVHRAVADELLERLVERTQALSIGNPTQRQNWLGPVTTQAGYDRWEQYAHQLRRDGSRIVSGGERLRTGDLEQGLFVQPTIAEAPAGHPLWRVEMFLPILMVNRVSSNEEAMRLANDSDLGLTAGFYGAPNEVRWFLEHIQAGTLYANRPQGATTGAWPGYQPFVGWKGSGNTGKAIASDHYLPQYLREQSQTVVE